MTQTAQFLWIGQLTKMETLCLRSFVHSGYEVHLYTYDEIEAPAGVLRFDAAEVRPRKEIFAQSHDGFGKGSFKGFSDRFCYHLLSMKGGWISFRFSKWRNQEICCLRPRGRVRGGNVLMAVRCGVNRTT